jgi:hypothetical protein
MNRQRGAGTPFATAAPHETQVTIMTKRVEQGAPVTEALKPRRCLRWTQRRSERFLEELGRSLNVRHSAARIGMSVSSAYRRKQRDPAFARAWAEALDMAYAELEMELLRQSLEGSVRTEEVRDGDGVLKQVKTVRSYPHGLAVRLLMAHREEVLAFRLASAQRQGEADVGARVRAHMDLVRARILGSSGPDEAPPEEMDDGA